ncbi:hypothetical protein EQG49_03285 [Periweissella cryptocerci]|uniref:DUF1905 domain-containing protein n=1 Tax=Periweissella cryptocerci TaxID=2506420 RepID=A0A4P6YS88_9LACO|nr:YdeI/OmpD-associated family protein [Periweissella cryptocerci]QBO35548.1 hypothetical protein EQG49_03285 [Periweissella cryptocerci]
MDEFTGELKIIGVNPYLEVPVEILENIFTDAGTKSGPIPVKGRLGEREYLQTLVKYAGEWRFYVNTTMLKKSPEHVGEILTVTIGFDDVPRIVEMRPELQRALAENPAAKAVLDNLAPSKQKEIIRYIANLKTKASVERNVSKAIAFLLGNGRFVGRDKP